MAGGCHVDGYPVGETAGFVDVAMKSLGVFPGNVKVFSPLHLGQASKLGDICACRRPHTLILQMGHFETAKRLLGTTNGESGSTSIGGSSRSLSPTAALFKTRLETLNWDIRNLIKLQLACIRGRAYFDASVVEHKIDVFCNEIAKLALSRVILLSPLPCADRVTQGNRLKLLPHFQANAKLYGFEYVDAMYSLLASARGKDIYYDAIHLNLKGHRLLARLVAQSLLARPASTLSVDH